MPASTAPPPFCTYFGKLTAFVQARDSDGLNEFVSDAARSVLGRKATWHNARLRFVHHHWRNENLDDLDWLQKELGNRLWMGLTVPAAWTLDTHDAMHQLRRSWHFQMLEHNDARGVFKNDPRAIELVEGRPKLSWLIAAMQSAKPKAYPALDHYFPGAFAYFEVLQMTGENPMDNAAFKDWILLNKHPGFNENLGDVEGQDLFGSPG